MNRHKKLLALLVFVLALVGCSTGSWSAYQPPVTETEPAIANTTANTTANTLAPIVVVANTPVPLVTLTGNVYVRDADGIAKDALTAGQTVQADCKGNWCYVTDGKFKGLKFWRGCSSDNPDQLGCQADK